MKKYVFTGKTKLSASGRLLHQIKAVRNLPSLHVEAGDIGGWIENEDNLSHDGNCWVFPDAEVNSDARVYENASIYGESIISGYAKVHGNARICEKVIVYEHADIYDNACVAGKIHIYGDAQLCGDAVINESVHGYPT